MSWFLPSWFIRISIAGTVQLILSPPTLIPRTWFIQIKKTLVIIGVCFSTAPREIRIHLRLMTWWNDGERDWCSEMGVGHLALLFFCKLVLLSNTRKETLFSSSFSFPAPFSKFIKTQSEACTDEINTFVVAPWGNASPETQHLGAQLSEQVWGQGKVF